ncbi:hypothetical protein N2152v2_006091 [Parachlorella kessleri]
MAAIVLRRAAPLLRQQLMRTIMCSAGAYRDEYGHPVVLQSVREAEKRIAGSKFMEYLPIGGHRQGGSVVGSEAEPGSTGAVAKPFCQDSIALVYGADALPVKNKTVAMVQALSGTGGCRLFADFAKRFMGGLVYLPNPTWPNHHNIFQNSLTYPYYNPETRGLDFEGMCSTLSKAPPGSIVLLHACAHNPTGVDPTPEQWKELSRLFREHRLFPFFDNAYQGFASGDFDSDALSVRTFLEDGHRLGVAQSYAKNAGLYGQRVGCFSLVCGSEAQAQSVESQIKALARPMYSSPPLHGALLMHTIMADDALKSLWLDEVKDMADRIKLARTLLRQNLEGLSNPLPWNHITDQNGMFCYSGLSPEQVDALCDEHHVYLTRNGRISMAGVNPSNVERLAKAIHMVTTGQKEGSERSGWYHAAP